MLVIAVSRRKPLPRCAPALPGAKRIATDHRVWFSSTALFKDTYIFRYLYVIVTMLGFLAVAGGLGALMVGLRIWEGGSKVGKAAESTADHARRALDSISNDVNEMKTIGGKAAESISNDVNEMKTICIFATKFVALLVCLLAALVCEKIASENSNRRRESNRSVSVTLEEPILQFLYWTFMLMAPVLALHLVWETCQITWPRKILDDNTDDNTMITPSAPRGDLEVHNANHLLDLWSSILRPVPEPCFNWSIHRRNNAAKLTIVHSVHSQRGRVV